MVSWANLFDLYSSPEEAASLLAGTGRSFTKRTGTSSRPSSIATASRWCPPSFRILSCSSCQSNLRCNCFSRTVSITAVYWSVKWGVAPAGATPPGRSGGGGCRSAGMSCGQLARVQEVPCDREGVRVFVVDSEALRNADHHRQHAPGLSDGLDYTAPAGIVLENSPDYALRTVAKRSSGKIMPLMRRPNLSPTLTASPVAIERPPTSSSSISSQDLSN